MFPSCPSTLIPSSILVSMKPRARLRGIYIYKSITMIQSLYECTKTCVSLSLSLCVCSSNIESVAWQLRGRCFHGRHLDWKLILNVVDVTRWVLSWLRYLRLNRKKLRMDIEDILISCLNLIDLNLGRKESFYNSLEIWNVRLFESK